MLFCFQAKEEERLDYEIEKFLEGFLKENLDLKIHKISEEEIDEIPLKITTPNLFGEKFLYYIPLIDKNKLNLRFLDSLEKIYREKAMLHFFVFGVVEIPKHSIWKNLEEGQRFFSFETIKYDKEWSLLSNEIIENVLKRNKKLMDYNGKNLIKLMCKGDPLRLKREMEKLCIYSNKEKIDLEAVKKLVDEEGSESFGLKNAIEKRDGKIYFDQIRKLLREGEPPILIFSILSKEIRFLIILKSILKKEDTILSRDNFIQKIYPQLKEKMERINKLEENYLPRIKNPNALFYSYDALTNYDLKELIELQQKINDYNLNIREGYEAEELLYSFGFQLEKKRRGEKDGF